jgi:hypothetical protein
MEYQQMRRANIVSRFKLTAANYKKKISKQKSEQTAAWNT